MSRAEGFDVMDVSTAITNDPKLRRLGRDDHDLIGPAFLAYMATMAESWRAGERVSIDDAWPAVLPFDDRVVTALRSARLLDARGLIPVKTWRGWFEPARERRDATRARWRRANDRRHVSTDDPRSDDNGTSAHAPRGSTADTGATVSQSGSDSDSRSVFIGDSSPSRVGAGETTTTPSERTNGREKDAYAGAHGMSRAGDVQLPRGLRR